VVFVAAIVGTQVFGTRWSLPSEGYWNLDIPIVNLFCRWDGGWYTNLAVSGYPGGSNPLSSNWAFFPEYPLLMRGFGALSFGALTPFQSALVAGFVISNVLFFVSLYLFYKLTTVVLNNPKQGVIASAFYAFWPGALFYSAVYSESLFMTLSLGAMYLLEKGKTASSTVLAFFASLARSNGFLIAAVFLFDGIQKRKYKTAIIQTILIFTPYLLFTVYGYFATGVFPVREVANSQQFSGTFGFVIPQLLELETKYFSFGYTVLYTFELLLVLVPFIWFFVSKEVSFNDFTKVLHSTRKDLKYWFLAFGVLVVLLFYSNVLNIHRYAILILPLYWVGALLWEKNRKVGALYLAFVIADLIIGSVLFATWRYYW
jgi:Gpi18-like mannosyltransferase